MQTAPKSKPRSDAWDATLSEAQRWSAYDRFRRAPWYAVSAWAAKEFGIPPPSRAALYRWAARMRSLESARRVEQAVAARDEIGALAGVAASGDRLVAAYKAMAAELALKGNAADAVRFTTMAMQLAAQQTAAAELDLKRRSQDTKEKALRLARQKFESAEARLDAAKDVVSDDRLSDSERTAKMKEIFGLK